VPADGPAAAALPDLSRWLGSNGRIVTSPAARCSVPGASVDLRLGPWDLGSWTGRSWAEIDLASWRADPSYAEHGGESLEALMERVSGLLRAWQGRAGRLAAVTHGAVIKCAVVQVLRAPIDAVWDLDVAHASLTELHFTGSAWRVTRVAAGLERRAAGAE
jgi:broad specificity phosphatase PhoE